MTVETSYAPVIYSGNGLVYEFPFEFYVESAGDLIVEVKASGASSYTAISSANYTLDLDAENLGGTVTYPKEGAAIPSGAKLRISRFIAYEQPVSIKNQKRYYADVLETALDRLSMQIQQVANKLNRALTFTVESTPTLDEVALEDGYLTIQDGAVVVETGNAGTAAIEAQLAAEAAEASATAAAGSASDALTSKNQAEEILTDVQEAVGEGIPRQRGPWTTLMVLLKDQLVQYDGSTYIVTVDHTAGVFNTDYLAGKLGPFALKGNAGAGAGDVEASQNLADLDDVEIAWVNLGGGTLGKQDADDVEITGGTISGLTTPLAIADGGTGATTAEGVRLALGLRTISVGSVVDSPNGVLPGTLKCNGAAVSRTTYSALFAFLGTKYGAGDGSTTFNLPDYRGVVRRGLDEGRGLDSGRTEGTYQADTMLNHTHSGTTAGMNSGNPHSHGAAQDAHDHSLPLSVQGSAAAGSATRFNTSNTTAVNTSWAKVNAAQPNVYIGAADINHSHNFTTGNPSAGGGTETRMKNTSATPCIYY